MECVVRKTGSVQEGTKGSFRIFQTTFCVKISSSSQLPAPSFEIVMNLMIVSQSTCIIICIVASLWKNKRQKITISLHVDIWPRGVKTHKMFTKKTKKNTRWFTQYCCVFRYRAYFQNMFMIKYKLSAKSKVRLY